MTTKRPQLEALGDFLRARRAEVDPASKGLPVGDRRRTPGLRREEVALLSNISASWYANLEQGRNVEPSVTVLDSIAAALDLDSFERRYLHLLALGRAPYRDQGFPPELRAVVEQLVRHLDPAPTYVADVIGEVLAWNDSCAQWLLDFATLPEGRRNVLEWMIHDPAARERFPDWEYEVRDILSRCRVGMATQPENPHVSGFLKRMRGADEQVRSLWELHEVSDIISRVRVLRHPELGERAFRLLVLTIGGADRIAVCVHVPEI